MIRFCRKPPKAFKVGSVVVMRNGVDERRFLVFEVTLEKVCVMAVVAPHYSYSWSLKSAWLWWSGAYKHAVDVPNEEELAVFYKWCFGLLKVC